MAHSSTTWLPSLIVPMPEAGLDLAVTLARMSVKLTRPSDEVRRELRPTYERDASAVIAGSQVIAVHFQTVPVANGWWST